MESVDNPSIEPDKLQSKEQRRLELANDFLEICDRLNNGYESGLYWEDVQRALRIATGLEKWRQRPTVRIIHP
ncbi:hypothetical protein [Spirosoma endophyticum]|uniref:Uncharacterized protein n=1 Tax=Spirosoma endophyticum TaxID=662367 RepID=A0A1I2HG62_9BACT|nr:hypothetical protein [Spirosoma endophyticum]SFF28712.1 hypothetical protein SAMN05216167_1439 [Spirosoma endophyticum]